MAGGIRGAVTVHGKDWGAGRSGRGAGGICGKDQGESGVQAASMGVIKRIRGAGRICGSDQEQVSGIGGLRWSRRVWWNQSGLQGPLGRLGRGP